MARNSIIVVDSTRRGKRFPDALAKTIPIWCTVINRALLLRKRVEGWSEDDLALYTPAVAVSASEGSQIKARLQEWAEALAVSCADPHRPKTH